LTVGVGDRERVTDHATTPGKTDPTKGIRSDDLENDIIWLAGWDICGLRYTVDDVA
jgi:hypothetical protein